MKSRTGGFQTKMFVIGDCIFLVAVGIVTTLVMHGMHQLGWNFVVTSALGMIAAMAVQMAMAFCIAPLLGSIESMTPSMVVGMVSPMGICLAHMIGHEPSLFAVNTIGTLVGVAMFVWVVAYGATINRRLNARLEAMK